MGDCVAMAVLLMAIVAMAEGGSGDSVSSDEAVVATEMILAIKGVVLGGIFDSSSSSSSSGDTVAMVEVAAAAAKVRGERILCICCYFKWTSKLDQQSAHISATDSAAANGGRRHYLQW